MSFEFCHNRSFEFCHNLSFCVMSQFELSPVAIWVFCYVTIWVIFFFFSFVTIFTSFWVFHNLSCWTLSQFDFLSFLTISVWSQFAFLSCHIFSLSFATIWIFKLSQIEFFVEFFLCEKKEIVSKVLSENNFLVN